MERPVGQHYEGPSGAMRDSVWLTWEDLPEGKDSEAKIMDIERHDKLTFEAGRTVTNKYSLVFKVKMLLVNAAHRKVMTNMFGTDTSQWIGKRITLYVSQTQMAGKTVNCVRIRDKGNQLAAQAAAALEGDHESEPTRGSDITPERGAFDEAVAMTGTPLTEAGVILAKCAGDYVAALAEINRRANERG
jgi:hypothetical protein